MGICSENQSPRWTTQGPMHPTVFIPKDPCIPLCSFRAIFWFSLLCVAVVMPAGLKPTTDPLKDDCGDRGLALLSAGTFLSFFSHFLFRYTIRTIPSIGRGLSAQVFSRSPFRGMYSSLTPFKDCSPVFFGRTT